jgi:2'-5' RNA ligase
MEKIASGHSGTFIGLIVPSDVANEIKVDGGESADDMHITMFYQKGMSKSDAEKVKKIWDGIWDEFGPIDVSINECDTFDATEHSDWKTPLICPVKTSIVHKLHDKLLAKIEAADIELNQTFPEYKPHVTLKYMDEDEEAPDSIGDHSFTINQYVFDPGGAESKVAHDGPLSNSDDAEDSYTDIDGTRGDLSIDPSTHITAHIITD